MKEYHFSGKFYGGIILIAVSLIIGKITQVLFLFHYNNPNIRWTALIIYILSWIPFFIGAWWVGKEYTNAIRKYFSYKYYHQTIKSGTQKAIAKTKEEFEKRNVWRNKYQKIQNVAKNSATRNVNENHISVQKSDSFHFSRISPSLKNFAHQKRDYAKFLKERTKNLQNKVKNRFELQKERNKRLPKKEKLFPRD